MLDPFYIKKIVNLIDNNVKFAFIFGSANTKYFNKKSDIDIAIWLEKNSPSVNEIVELKYQIEKSINFKYDIDLVILNNADIIITNQIITNGKIIINNDVNFTANYINSRKSMYLDFKFFRKNLENNLKTKIL